MTIHPIMTRVAYITTENTGGSLDVPAPEGVMQVRRVDPHGCRVEIGGQGLSIRRENLVVIGRFFLAAALLLGEDINAGWDAPEAGR